jgi:RNA polymerase sigma-70 factor (ECF subfamily)
VTQATSGPNDRELLARLSRGDEAAYDALFRECYPGLVLAAERLLGDRAAAEDAAQEVMVELWRRHDSLPAGLSVRGYLFQSVRNRSLNQLRHARIVRRAEPQVRPPSAPPPADAGALTSELAQAMREAVASLPPELAEAFQLSRGEGLTYTQIAARLGIPVKTLETRMGRCLRLLREKLAPWLPPGGEW